METDSRHFVTEAVVRTFETDGVVLLPGVIDSNWLDRLQAAVERDIAHPGPHFHGYRTRDGRGGFHGSMRLWEHDTDFRDYCESSPLPAMAAALLKTDKVNLFYDQLFVKEPETPARTRWHNDQPYWPVRGWPVMSFWLALDPVTRRSGALEFIRHDIGRFYGAYSVTAGDLDGDGDLDVVAGSFFTDLRDPRRYSLIWFENDGQQAFRRRSIARLPRSLVSLELVDLDANGSLDLVAGGLMMPAYANSQGHFPFQAVLSVWRNQ